MQTKRDAQIVDWLGRIGAAGAEHVSELFGIARGTCYLRLLMLSRAGLLDYRRILYDRPGLYSATARGLRWQGLGRLGVVRLWPGEFEHSWQVATAAVAIQRSFAGWSVWGEREARALERDEGTLLASAQIGRKGSQALIHAPDLALVSPTGRRLSVEVELSVKTPARLARIARGWARAGNVDHVYYLATPEAAKAVDRALDRVKAHDRVTVLDLEDVAGLAAHALAREEAHAGSCAREGDHRALSYTHG